MPRMHAKMIDLASDRIQHELLQLYCMDEQFRSDFSVNSINETGRDYIIEMVGPQGTPYEGGIFTLNMKVPNDYPMAPPHIAFITKVWHPNIYCGTGVICLSLLNADWEPSISLSGILLSIRLLLSTPNAEEGVNLDAARQFLQNHETFLRTATYWTYVYAGGPYQIPEYIAKTTELIGEGFDEHIVRVVLTRHNWCLEPALKFLKTHYGENRPTAPTSTLLETLASFNLATK